MSRTVLCLALLASIDAGPASAAELRLEIADGYVTLVATDAPVRQILAEWARVGGTRIINAESVAGPPVTLQLQRVPEQQALAVLLRSVAGYLAAPRRAGTPGASQYESVMILATSTPPATSPAAAGRAPVNRGNPRVDIASPQPGPEGGGPGESEGGFITIGSAPTPRQTPAPGGVTTGPAGMIPKVDLPPGVPPRPTTVKPGVVFPDETVDEP
jgi:hypothetical protein